MDADVKRIFDQCDVVKDLNVFMFVLDPEGRLVHGFKGLPGGRNPTYLRDEIRTATEKMRLPDVPASTQAEGLPDVKGPGSPAGVRLFVRTTSQERVANVVVEAMPLDNRERQALSFPETARELDPETLRSWFVQLYPPAIRTVEQSKPFKRAQGTLKMQQASQGGKERRALLRGSVQLTREGGSEPAFKGTCDVVIFYGAGGEIRSIKGFVEGVYIYRLRGAVEYQVSAALESRPE
jgi:hypothetical protein